MAMIKEELSTLDDNPSSKKKRPNTCERNGRSGESKAACTNDAIEYDSHENVEMTEANRASYKTVAFKIYKWWLYSTFLDKEGGIFVISLWIKIHITPIKSCLPTSSIIYGVIGLIQFGFE